MFTMFTQIFTTIAVFFRSIERAAQTVDNYAKWAEKSSEAFEMENALILDAKLRDLEARLTAAK